jgi:ubiquinone/menaquinone biosynthesis C-methylase UbiE
MASLLPKERTAFADKKYWNDFNAKTSEFEWYGSYKQLQAALAPYLQPGASLLVVGCGNSAFSAELYDAGVTTNVANMDYDDRVIQTMAERNKARPQMKWQTDDMRVLSTFEDASFDVVIDKGALDALMSSPEAKPDALEMMASITRKLKPGGRYLCITLSQSFVFNVLSDALTQHYDSGEIKVLKGAAGSSNHVPFLFVFRSKQVGEPSAAASQFEVSFDAAAVDTSPFKQRVFGEQCWRLVQSAQGCFGAARARAAQGTLHPGRVQRVDLWGPGAEKTPRFSVAVVDTTGGDQPMACFIVPQGREHEYLFSSEG